MAAMRLSRAVALALLGGCLSMSSAQVPSAAPTCIERLVIPQYPISARSAGISGLVDVALTWSESGKVQWRIESAAPHFGPAVEEALKRSKFAQSCRDGQVKITFDFVVSGSRRKTFRQEVVFLPPLRFQILTDLMELNP
jgi:TonB family protein